MTRRGAKDPYGAAAFVLGFPFIIELVFFSLWKHYVVTGDGPRLRSYRFSGTPLYPGEVTLFLIGFLVTGLFVVLMAYVAIRLDPARPSRVTKILPTGRIGYLVEGLLLLGLPAVGLWLALEILFRGLIGPVAVRSGVFVKFVSDMAWPAVLLAIIAIARGVARPKDKWVVKPRSPSGEAMDDKGARRRD